MILLVFLPGALLNELCFMHEGARPVGKAGAQDAEHSDAQNSMAEVVVVP